MPATVIEQQTYHLEEQRMRSMLCAKKGCKNLTGTFTVKKGVTGKLGCVDVEDYKQKLKIQVLVLGLCGHRMVENVGGALVFFLVEMEKQYNPCYC